MKVLLCTLLLLSWGVMTETQAQVLEYNFGEEPDGMSLPIPPADTTVTDSTIVTESSQYGIIKWKCYTHAFALMNSDRYFLARVCSTAAYVGSDPIVARYIDVFGPYVVNRLSLADDFVVTNRGRPINQENNAHMASLAYRTLGWRAEEGNRVIRAPSAHMGYLIGAPGGAVSVGFSHAAAFCRLNEVDR